MLTAYGRIAVERWVLWGGAAKIRFFTYLQYPAARLQTGIIHAGLVHAQRDAVQQDDQNGDALKPRARVQSPESS